VPKAKSIKTIQFLLRLPSDVHDWITDAAQENGRSINSEILARLEKSKADSTIVKHLEEQVELLWDAITELQQKSHDHLGELRG
jgi:hypothetical protein